VPVTVLCNNNEIYGLTGGQTGPTTPSGTKTLSSPAGNPNIPINLQGIVRSSAHALYAKTTVYHQLHMRNVIREALEWDGFSFVDITSQCIENNGRRIGFASANDMLAFYRKTYKRAAKGAERLNPFEIGILYPVAHPTNGNGAARAQTDVSAAAAGGTTAVPERPPSLPEQPAGPMQSASDSPATAKAPAKAPATDDEKARKREVAQQRLALMNRLGADVKLRVAKGETSLLQALTEAGLEVPEWLRTGASAPAGAPTPESRVERSATGADPQSEAKPELDAQKAEAKAEGRGLVRGELGGSPQPIAPRTEADARPAQVSGDPAERKRVEAHRRLALMQRLPSELKLRVAKREISLADALHEAGIDPAELEG